VNVGGCMCVCISDADDPVCCCVSFECSETIIDAGYHCLRITLFNISEVVGSCYAVCLLLVCVLVCVYECLHMCMRLVFSIFPLLYVNTCTYKL
jgi:hypothetical protein